MLRMREEKGTGQEKKAANKKDAWERRGRKAHTPHTLSPCPAGREASSARQAASSPFSLLSFSSPPSLFYSISPPLAASYCNP